MNIRRLPRLNPFQRLVITVCSVLRLRGYDSTMVTLDEVVRICSTVPRAKKFLIQHGSEWHWPREEQERLFEVVKFNMAFFEQRIFVFGELMDIEDPNVKAEAEAKNSG